MGTLMDSTLDPAQPAEKTRRSWVSSIVMGSGIVAGYGYFAGIAARFLYPAAPEARAWQFVAVADRIPTGSSLNLKTPEGQPLVIMRQGEAGTDEDFIALSGVCPHLGCMVNWEPQNNRFFCPCHNGAFDPSGNPTQGPPHASHQTLSRFPLKVENGLLLVQVSMPASEHNA